ncbi:MULTISPECIES: hypothetical protein [unclassified Arsenophonus]|uniref:hypothetical protein n=1 Tax=unclassified Arsenophonus TaxID=2627083 RepID=UPI00285A3FFC|nr:hypothetical protein [Arsenophonus sp.]MDR5610994.1 hypothetical protein [Arsenophonus sp.]MDR5614949.1 hypothetical protein [Arsenophonus sp.]
MLLLIIYAKTPFERIKLAFMLLTEAGKILFRRGIYAVREYQAEGDLNTLNQTAEVMTKNQKRGINK